MQAQQLQCARAGTFGDHHNGALSVSKQPKSVSHAGPQVRDLGNGVLKLLSNLLGSLGCEAASFVGPSSTGGSRYLLLLQCERRGPHQKPCWIGESGMMLLSNRLIDGAQKGEAIAFERHRRAGRFFNECQELQLCGRVDGIRVPQCVVGVRKQCGGNFHDYILDVATGAVTIAAANRMKNANNIHIAARNAVTPVSTILSFVATFSATKYASAM